MPRMPEAFRLHFEIQYVGKTIKASKRRITWKFAFAGDQDEHSVVLVHTINSGKKVVFLNGNQIHEDDKMSLSQWVYPFQLEGHLVSVVIEGTGTLSDKEGYDLQIDGRMWNDMRLTTLLDLRAAQMRRAGGEVPRETREAMSAWTRGGAVAGVAVEAPTKSWDEDRGSYEYRGAPGSSRGREGSAAVPVKSMSDFLGSAAATGGASGSGGRPAASSGGGAGDFGFGDAAGGGGGGSWDPFAGVGGGKGGAPAVPVRASRESLGARAAPAHHAAAAPEASHAAGGLRPPPAAGRSHGGGGAGAAAGGRSSFAAPAPASLADDLAGLSFGGSAPAPARAPAAAAAGAYDPFGSSSGGAGAADPFGSAPSSPAAAAVDIFAQPPGPAAPFPAHALAAATAAGAAGGARASPAASAGVLEGGLINLDNLTDTGKGAAAGAAGSGSKAAPSLAQLKASTGIGGSGLASAPSKPVMANNAAGTTGLGLSPLDLYTPAMPSAGMGAAGGMAMGYGARPMGPGAYGGPAPGAFGGAPGFGGPAGPYGGGPAPGGGFGGGFGGGYGGAPAAPNPFGTFGAPAPAPAPRSADYNPFE